jgi:hypothetical protein
MLRKSILVLLPLLVLGCAGSPGRVLLTKAEKLREVSSFDLCRSFFLRPTTKLRLELKERNEFTPGEWAFIDEQRIHVGMRELVLVCAWGYPGYFGTVSESVVDDVTHRQWVYRACPGCKALYVYTENGKVTGWQNLRKELAVESPSS